MTWLKKNKMTELKTYRQSDDLAEKQNKPDPKILMT